MERIVFVNGKAVSSAYLNSVQEGSKFTGDTRTDYYSDPSAQDEAGWEIGQRDTIKDWEIADPRVDQESAVGRTAHDGIVLGWDGEAVRGVPAIRPYGEGGLAVTVEAGSIISRDGQVLSWARQPVIVNRGPDQVFYLYVLEGESPLTVSIGSELPNVTEPHTPLAKITLNSTGDELATSPITGEVVGTGYIDLRPNTFVGNLNTYPQNLINTSIKNSDYVVGVWERVIADTSNGSIVITLPESPADSDRIAIIDIMGTFDRFPIILRVNPVSNELLNNSPDDWIVNIRDTHLELFYHAATGQWKFEEASGSSCSPFLGTFLSCGGQELIGDRTAGECPDGQPLPARYPEGSAGTYQFEPSLTDPSLGKCYRQYNETVALYANGVGGLITVVNTPRCIREGSGAVVSTAITRNTIYVDQTVGDDGLDNRGMDRNRPFRTIERAIIEGVRESRRSGQSNDRYDRIVIDLAAGDYYVDNSPGNLSALSLTDETGLIQRTSANLSIISTTEGDRNISFTVDVGDSLSTQPPHSLNLGRVLYSESGGVGNVARVEKISGAIWLVTLEYVNGTFVSGDELFYDNLAAVNPSQGALIVPRGISIDGSDLRKVRIRPMYVPELDPVQTNPQTQRTAIFKVTGGTYISLMTFTDNPQYARSHNTVTSIAFASQAEIYGSGSETSYYSRINDLFKEIDGWGSDLLEAIPAETAIVAPIASSKENRAQDLEENQTGLQSADSRIDAPISYPGATKIRDTDGSVVPLPDVNSTRSASPYVFNCSVRSIFGLNGLWAEGSRVSGFKSMVTANFTQVSLQTDPNCFASGTYFDDPTTEIGSGEGKRYKDCAADPFKYRHFGMRGSNDGSIQIVSVFVIGNSDHFVCESGADLSITNSCSDFGDISLRGVGYKSQSFSQDEKASEPGYSGTRITKIIPPLPLSYNPLTDGRPPTLEDSEVSTGYTIQYGKTLAYTVANKVGTQPPATMRIYIQSTNIASPLSLDNPPSASDMSFGQYSYTKKTDTSTWELVGGPAKANRKRIYVTGFDENGNSILYTGDLTIPSSGSNGFDRLDDRSKVFVWDPAPQDYDEDGDPIVGSGAWYMPVTWSGIADENTDLDNDGYLLKSFPYAFRYKLMTSPTGQDAIYAGIDFMFDRSSVRIVRAIDKRSDDERVYRVVLDGFLRDRGVRRPQPYYVLEKQQGVSGYPLNASGTLATDPLTVTQVRTYDEVFRPGKQDIQFPGQYVTYLALGSEARQVFTGDFVPNKDNDYPELTEDPGTSPTKVALAAMGARSGVFFSAPLQPSASQIDVKVSSSAALGIKVGLRRPSVIRASGHTWEWTGYLNYDTSFPTFQGEPLTTEYALGRIISEENGGRVYATGMNEEGNYYIGTTVFDLRSGEQFAIPLASDGAPPTPTNQILNSVIVRDTLFMQDNSSVVLGKDTTVFVNDTTQIKSLTSGDIVAKTNPAALYATTTRAGLVQLATPEIIANATSPSAAGISDKVVVTALDLANALAAGDDLITPDRLSPGGPNWNTSGDLIAGRNSLAERFLVKSPGRGTAALPSFSFDVDGDTGMFSPGNNTLAFSTSGTESLRIFNNNSVSIGTTSLYSGTSDLTTKLNVAGVVRGEGFASEYSLGGNPNSNNIPPWLIAGELSAPGVASSTTDKFGYLSGTEESFSLTSVPSPRTTGSSFIKFDNLSPGVNKSSSWLGAYYNGEYSSDLVLYTGKKGNNALNANQSAKSVHFSQNYIKFYTAERGTGNPSEERMRIVTEDNGNSYVRFSEELNGLQFNGDTSSSSAIKFEVGTWVPTVWGGSTLASLAVSQYLTRWTRVGNIVTATARIVMGSVGNSSASLLEISLPYAPRYLNTLPSTPAEIQVFSSTGSTRFANLAVRLSYIRNGRARLSSEGVNFSIGSGGIITLSISYEVNP